MEDHHLSLKPLPASEVIIRLAKVVDAFESLKGARSISVSTNGMSILSVSGVSLGALVEDERVVETVALLKDRTELTNVQATVSVADPNPPNNQQVKSCSLVYQVDGISAGIKVGKNGHGPSISVEEFFQIIDLVTENFDVFAPTTLAAETFPIAEQQRLAAYEQAVKDLTAQVARLGEFTAKQVEQNNERFQNRMDELDEKNKRDRSAQETEIEDRRSQLAEREKEVAEREAELNYRTPSAVRRDIYDQMLDRIKQETENIGLSEKVEEAKTPVRLTLGFFSALLVLLISALVALVAWEKLTVWGLVPAGVMVTVLLGFLIYWATLEVRHFRDLADAEFDLRKLRADTNRAQYVTELVMEVANQEKVELPDGLLVALTRGLFGGRDRLSEPRHPIDTALQKASRLKKAKVSTGGLDVEME